MSDRGLDKAKEVAEKARFSVDEPLGFPVKTGNDTSGREYVKSSLLQNSLNISEMTTPRLERTLRAAVDQLFLPREVVDAYVFSGSAIQAYCITTSDDGCLIGISSEAVNLLEKSELQFLFGHEIAHFLLGHGSVSEEANSDATEYGKVKRAQELSADRVGLLAVSDLNVSLRAIMKTLSGLPSNELRFDFSALIRQVERAKWVENIGLGTHPTMVMRARALMWFSNIYFEGHNDQFESEKEVVDSRIEADINKYSEAYIDEQINLAKINYEMWKFMLPVVKEGRFDREKQEEFKGRFGPESLKKMINFVNELDVESAERIVSEKVLSAEKDFRKMAPVTYSKTQRFSYR